MENFQTFPSFNIFSFQFSQIRVGLFSIPLTLFAKKLSKTFPFVHIFVWKFSAESIENLSPSLIQLQTVEDRSIHESTAANLPSKRFEKISLRTIILSNDVECWIFLASNKKPKLVIFFFVLLPIVSVYNYQLLLSYELELEDDRV